MLSPDLLKDYQNRGIQFGMDNADLGCYLAADCGLGKTVMMQTILSMLLSSGVSKRVLVLAPPRVGKFVWRQESQAWSHLTDLEVVPVLGTPKQRLEILETDPQVSVLSYDLLSWLNETYGDALPFDTLVLDEASMVKSRTSKRFKTLRKMRNKFERVYLMSATPSADSIESLWSQYFMLDKGERLGKYFTYFQRSYFYPTDYNKFYWELREGALDKIVNKISDRTLRLSAEEHLNLPALSHNKIRVDLGDCYSDYLALEREFFLELRNAPIVAVNSAVLSGKLRQFTNGFLYDEDGDSHEVHTAKLDGLGELLEDTKPLLLFYEYKSDWERIKKRFPFAEHIKDVGVIDRFNDNKVRLLCGNSKSMSHGLNLQMGGCSRMVFFSLPWSNELYTQAIGRLHRQGNDSRVTAHYIVGRNTIDEKVSRALINKQNLQDALLKGVRKNFLLGD